MAEESASAEAVKGEPIPTRFDDAEDRLIRDLNRLTGLPMAEIIRRAGRFALPKFASGRVNILTLAESDSPVPLNGDKPKRRKRELAHA